MILNSDGGARGNPGPAAAGVILRKSSGEKVKGIGKYLGICTNNEAEYKALILGMSSALLFEKDELRCVLDSELVVKQLNGEYRIKDTELRKLYLEVKELEKKFGKVLYKHVSRSENKEADRLVNKTLDFV